MKVIKDQLINAPLETVWQIFGHEFADAYLWSSFVHSSSAKTDGPSVGDASISGRTCDTPLGLVDETLEIFSNEGKELKFHVVGKGFPFFLRSVDSHWKFSEEAGRTRANTEVTLNLMFPFNLVMGPILKRNFLKTLEEGAREIEAHAKTRLAG